MATDILNRWTRAVVFHCETADTIAAAVLEACNACADLRDADLRYADLRYAVGLLPNAVMPLQICGSRDSLIVREVGQVSIGCEHHPVAWWEEHYAAICKVNSYTDTQVLEYRRHIAYAREWMETNGVLDVQDSTSVNVAGTPTEAVE